MTVPVYEKPTEDDQALTTASVSSRLFSNPFEEVVFAGEGRQGDFKSWTPESAVEALI